MLPLTLVENFWASGGLLHLWQRCPREGHVTDRRSSVRLVSRHSTGAAFQWQKQEFVLSLHPCFILFWFCSFFLLSFFPFFPLSSALLSPSPPECCYYWHVPSCPGAWAQGFLSARQALSSWAAPHLFCLLSFILLLLLFCFSYSLTISPDWPRICFWYSLTM